METESECIDSEEERLKPRVKRNSLVLYSALSQSSSIYLPETTYTFKEVKNMASLLRTSCAMAILQFKLLL